MISRRLQLRPVQRPQYQRGDAIGRVAVALDVRNVFSKCPWILDKILEIGTSGGWRQSVDVEINQTADFMLWNIYMDVLNGIKAIHRGKGHAIRLWGVDAVNFCSGGG